jgi:sarcosine oxidase
MKTDYHSIVLGLGGLGSGALYWLSHRLGSNVLGIEQFECGHVRGGSHDHSRIIRLSYHTSQYVELAKQAYAAWQALETDCGESLILKTGGLDLSPQNAAYPIEDYTRSLDAAHVPYETLSASEVMHRFPQFCLSDDIQGVYQADAGIAPAAKGVATHLRMAQAHGAEIRENAPITRITPLGEGLEIEAGGVTYRCQKLVVCAGAWLNNALSYFGRSIPLTVTQEQVTYLASPQLNAFAPDRFPVWIWMTEPSFYGFPLYGEPAVKIAQDVGGEEVTAESRTFESNPAMLQRCINFMQAYLPSAVGPVHMVKTCLYDMPPDRNFIIDMLPEHPNVIVANGAAHAFKFSTLIGRICSELALDGVTQSDISGFEIDRPILLEANPIRNFMC